MANPDTEYLRGNQQKRAAAVAKHAEFLAGLTSRLPSGRYRRGIRYRRWLVPTLQRLAETVFEDEDIEYARIQKFGRGALWSEAFEYFNKTELAAFAAFAQDFGAMDY